MGEKTLEEITGAVRAAQALRDSEGGFAAAFTASPIAMAITTLDEGRYVDVNEAFEQQIGYSRLEVCGRTSLEMAVWPTPADRQAMVTALKERDTIRSRPTVFRTKSGGLITTLYSATLIEVDGLPCVLAAIQDITAQRMAEDALRESEAKFRLLAETSPLAILLGGADHRVRFCNPAFERTFQYASDETIGKDPDDLISLPENAEASDISRRVLSGQSVHATAIRRRKDGSRIHVDLHAAPLY